MLIFSGRTTNLHLVIMASHFVVHGGFGFVAIERETAHFAVVIQIAGPVMAPTLGDCFTFCITTVYTFSVHFGFFGVIIFKELQNFCHIHPVRVVVLREG